MGFIHKCTGVMEARDPSIDSYNFVKYIASSGFYIVFKFCKNNENEIILFQNEYQYVKTIKKREDIFPIMQNFNNLYENNNRDTDGGALIDYVAFLENIFVDTE